MEEIRIENPISDTELSAQLAKELKTLNEEREKITESLLEQEDASFSKEKYTVLENAIKNIEPEMVEIYVRSLGYKLEDLIDNHENYRKFEIEKLAPINEKISEVNTKLRTINFKIAEAERERKAQEEKEAFEAAKNELITGLYEGLEKIHGQIPQEAHDSGMTTENALETYLPNLVYKAQLIESYINRADDVYDSLTLRRLRDEIEQRAVLSK
jgi:hypothetical protein